MAIHSGRPTCLERGNWVFTGRVQQKDLGNAEDAGPKKEEKKKRT